MYKIFCCYNIILDFILRPGWDDDQNNLEDRNKKIDQLGDLIDSERVRVYIPDNIVQLLHSTISDQFNQEEAGRAIQNILKMGTTNLGVNSDHIWEQAISLNYPKKSDLVLEGTNLIVAKELQLDAILAHPSLISDLQRVISLNSDFFSDFNVPILNLDSFFFLLEKDEEQNDHYIYVLTPHDNIIKLPHGATPIDFAYAVHTSIGNRCYQALVNGLDYPLEKPLFHGARVEIIKSSETKPNPDWLNFVVTATAKKSIENFLRRDQQNKGWTIIKKRFGKVVRSYRKNLEYAASKLGYKALDELALEIGTGKQNFEEVEKIINDYNCAVNQHCLIDAEKILLKGTRGQNFEIARCCCPLPKYPIVGISNSLKQPIRVHKKDCNNITNIKPEQRIFLDWNCEKAKISLLIRLTNHPDTLRPLLNRLVEKKGLIPDLHSIFPSPDGDSLAVISIILCSNNNLEEILNLIKQKSKVRDVRVKNISLL